MRFAMIELAKRLECAVSRRFRVHGSVEPHKAPEYGALQTLRDGVNQGNIVALLCCLRGSGVRPILELMNASSSGRVASLHLHPHEPGDTLVSVQAIEVIEGKGIQDNPRYFGRVSKSTGQPNRRQVSLIEREQIAEHATTLGLQSIAPGAVRSNIETSGIDLVGLVGREVRIGTAVLLLYAPRDPCEKMDRICQGLREQMMSNRQGVLAEVVRSGRIQVGDEIVARAVAEVEANPS